MTWLTNNLQNTPAGFHKFVFMHHPVIWCDNNCWDGGTIANAQAMKDICATYGVDAVFTGHEYHDKIYEASTGSCDGLRTPGVPLPSDTGPFGIFSPSSQEYYLHGSQTMYVVTGATWGSKEYRVIGVDGNTVKVYETRCVVPTVSVAQQRSSQTPRNADLLTPKSKTEIVRLRVRDSQGNVSGESDSGQVLEQVPNCSFGYAFFNPDSLTIDTVGSRACVPYGADDCVFEIKAITEGLTDLQLVRRSNDSGTMIAYYTNVSVTDSSTGWIQVTTHGIDVTLYMDDDGDSIVDREIEPVIWPLARGDANGDGVINIADVVYLLNYLFTGGPAPVPLEAGDTNCDTQVNIADVVYLINYLFAGGDPPGC